MWPFLKSISLLDAGVFKGMTDCHSHILPGVDDGVRKMEESLAILSEYERLGIEEVWLTPHVMEDIPNKPSDLRQRFGELCSRYTGPLKLHLGAENMIDSLFVSRLESGDLLPVGPAGDHLLVETSYFTPPMGFLETLERIKHAGFHPVLAHPERYVYMDLKDYDRLKEMGVLFQLNVFSLVGLYDEGAQRVSRMLLKKGYYDYAGTDIHALRILRNFVSGKLDKALAGSLSLLTCNKY